MERARWVEAYRASGLGMKRFAVEHGLKAGQLHYWVYAGRKARVAAAGGPVFREVKLAGASGTGTAWGVEMVLPDGTILRLDRGVDVAGVIGLVESLRRPCLP